jgi:glucan biosynthesis protein C
VLFALGVHAAEAGWLGGLPPVLVRRLGWVAATALAVLEMLVAVELARGQFEELVAGAGWPTMAFALLDGVITIAATLWFIAWLRSRWPAHGPLLGKAGRASYATYFSHPLYSQRSWWHSLRWRWPPRSSSCW